MHEYGGDILYALKQSRGHRGLWWANWNV